MYELKVTTHFAGAHQLKVAQKCENLHGHNWKIEVILSGEDLDADGVLLDFGVVKRHLSEIMEMLDHRFLNELEWFSGDCPPSSENIARFVARELQEKIRRPAVRISRVSAWESENACATYIPD